MSATGGPSLEGTLEGEQHGGRLSARKHPDGGAEFTLELPLAG